MHRTQKPFRTRLYPLAFYEVACRLAQVSPQSGQHGLLYIAAELAGPTLKAVFRGGRLLYKILKTMFRFGKSALFYFAAVCAYPLLQTFYIAARGRHLLPSAEGVAALSILFQKSLKNFFDRIKYRTQLKAACLFYKRAIPPRKRRLTDHDKKGSPCF